MLGVGGEQGFMKLHHSQSFSKSAQEFARQFGGPVNLDCKISHPKRRSRKSDDAPASTSDVGEYV